MPTLDTLFIIIVSVMAVSLVLAIVDWIYLASLASKSAILEREVEKKSQEFDALKKERAAEQVHSGGGATVIESTEPLVNNPAPTHSNEDTIQVVRNVRGNFQQSEPFTDNNTGESGSPPHPAPPPDTSIGTLDYSTVIPYAHDHDYETIPEEHTSAPPSEPEETLLMSSEADEQQTYQVYDDSRKNDWQQQSLQSWLVQLYSDATKDADFQLLWKHITEIIQTQPDAPITIDLSNINFMYDKEMEYLEKINYLLAGQGGALSLIHCDAELLELFKKRPLLRSLVQQKAV